MLNYYTDRHPALSALIIAALFTVIPSAAMLFLGGFINMPVVIFVYALVIQVVLWMTVERPILVFMPFILSLIYTVSESAAAPGAGVGQTAFVVSSLIVTVFGAESAASVGAIVCYGIISLARKIWDAIAHR